MIDRSTIFDLGPWANVPMPQRVDAGTDIAKIGVWDPAHVRLDLEDASYFKKDAAYREEAKCGRLFYVNTGSDGEFPIEFYVEETPSAEMLTMYRAIARPFLIVCQSGRLAAAGVEDFTCSTMQITSAKDEIHLLTGRYALTLYQLDDDKAQAGLVQAIGTEDYEYYQRQWKGLPWGCLLPFVAAVLLFVWVYVSIAIFVIWAVYLYWSQRRLTSDARYQRIAKRIEEYDARFSGWVITLRSYCQKSCS